MNTRTPCVCRAWRIRRRAGVAGGGAEDVQGFALLGQGVFKQIAQQLHGHVFEGQGRAVGQLLDIQAVFQALERGDFIRAVGGGV